MFHTENEPLKTTKQQQQHNLSIRIRNVWQQCGESVQRLFHFIWTKIICLGNKLVTLNQFWCWRLFDSDEILKLLYLWLEHLVFFWLFDLVVLIFFCCCFRNPPNRNYHVGNSAYLSNWPYFTWFLWWNRGKKKWKINWTCSDREGSFFFFSALYLQILFLHSIFKWFVDQLMFNKWLSLITGACASIKLRNHVQFFVVVGRLLLECVVCLLSHSF